MIDWELDRLNRLILGAIRLGFTDDVAHWKAERERYIAERNSPISGPPDE
jgi:hypothetical protein